MRALVFVFVPILASASVAVAGEATYEASCACDGKIFAKGKLPCTEGSDTVRFTAAEDHPDEKLNKLAQARCSASPNMDECPSRACKRKVVGPVIKVAAAEEEKKEKKKESVGETFLRRMNDTHQLSKAAVCDAHRRLDIVEKKRPLPKCEVAKDSGIKRVTGDQCNTHYTLHTPEKPSADPDIEETVKHTICQCNHQNEHSELISLAAGATRMANLAYPCKSTCYPALIKHLAGQRKASVHISYASVRGDSSKEIHDDLAEICE